MYTKALPVRSITLYVLISLLNVMSSSSSEAYHAAPFCDIFTTVTRLSFELALPAIAFAQARMRIEQEVAEVLQRGQLAQLLALDFIGAVLGDGGKAGVDVFHHAFAVDQQEGVGALFDSPLKQVQSAGGGTSVVIVDDLRKLVGQLAGKGYFIRLPHPAFAYLLNRRTQRQPRPAHPRTHRHAEPPRHQCHAGRQHPHRRTGRGGVVPSK